MNSLVCLLVNWKCPYFAFIIERYVWLTIEFWVFCFFSFSSLSILFLCFLTSLLLMGLFKLFEFVWTFELFLFTQCVIFLSPLSQDFLFTLRFTMLWLGVAFLQIYPDWGSLRFLKFLSFTKLRKFQPLLLQISCSLHFLSSLLLGFQLYNAITFDIVPQALRLQIFFNHFFLFFNLYNFKWLWVQ